MGNAPIQAVATYKYLGIIIDNGGRFVNQRETIKRKGLALEITLRNPKRRGTILTPLIRVAQVKILPTSTYVSEAKRGRDCKILDKTLSKAYRIMFSLPNYTPVAQIRLEFGLTKQSLARQGAYIICCKKIRRAAPNTLNG